MGLTFMEKHRPDDVSPPGGFQYSSAGQGLCWFLLLFLPVLQSPGQGQAERGAGSGSISNSILKIGNSRAIFISGKADKEF